ncbi:MAG: hypothetical protein V5B34_13230 [Accumulibacter sp.]|jgi:hypothetical protein
MAAKPSTKHPYAAIEHRVIDSPAYASLTFSARALLTMLTRQLTKTNNGHLQATLSYLSPYGFDSDKTITRGIRDLIAVGLVYRTRAGGFHQGPSRYAVTWLPIAQRDGLYLHGFKSCAWRDWQPPENKNTPPKIRTDSRKNVPLTIVTTDKSTAEPGDKSTDNELMPCRGAA